MRLIRSGRRSNLLQRRERGRHRDLCQRRRAGPDPVGAGHVSSHRPVAQAGSSHAGAEAELQERDGATAGRTHLSVL